MGEHTAAVACDDDVGLVLVCECGWRSTPARTGEEVGSAFDRHRDEPCAS